MGGVLKSETLSDGREVAVVVLERGRHRVELLGIGAATRDWRVLRRDGAEQRIVLGLPSVEAYLGNPHYMGIIAGRVANRIAGASFCVEGRRHVLVPNEGRNLLHGGAKGLGRRLWQAEIDTAGSAVCFRRHAPDGEDGFPGAVDFEVIVRLSDTGLSYEMHARPDRPTPISLAQHNYYNLGPGPTILDHWLRVAADRWTPVGPDLIPTGAIAPVPERLDFRPGAVLADKDPDGCGIDVNLLLERNRDPAAPVAELRGAGGLGLRLRTDQPAMQVYTGSGLGGQGSAPRFGGICLEPQFPPDAANQSQFGDIVHTPERPYFQHLRVDIFEGDS